MSIQISTIKVLDSKSLTIINLDSNVFLMASELSKVIGKQTRHVADKIKKKDNFIEGVDYIEVNGEILKEIKAALSLLGDRRYSLTLVSLSGMQKVQQTSSLESLESVICAVKNVFGGIIQTKIGRSKMGILEPVTASRTINQKLLAPEIVICGIDVGLLGSIFFITGDMGYIKHYPMPLIDSKTVDDHALLEIFNRHKPDIAVIEMQGVRMNENNASNFKGGSQCGAIRGMLLATGCDKIYLPEPRIVQNAISKGLPGKSTKDRSMYVANKLFKTHGPFSEGCADACIISIWGILKDFEQPHYPSSQDQPFIFKRR